MDDPKTVPSLSPAEAEEFFAGGVDARSAAPDSLAEPGSLSRLPDISQGSPACSGRAGIAGDGPTTAAGDVPDNPSPAADQADGFASELRCRECGTLRRALPRHAAHCRYAHQNCPGCLLSGEKHLASCERGPLFKLPTDTCCAGVDMPGQGNVHESGCKNPRPVLRASHALPAQPPAPSTAAEFAGPSGLFGQLLFAARDLGRSLIVDLGVARTRCMECMQADSSHSSLCKTGRVLCLVDRICAVSPLFQAAALANDLPENDLPADARGLADGGAR